MLDADDIDLSFEDCTPVEPAPPQHRPARVSEPPSRALVPVERREGGRSLPHSLEAEEHLLSACMLDGQDVVARCIDSKLTPAAFYDAKNSAVFGCILGLFHERKPIDVAIIHEELKAKHQLESAGGLPYLMQVSQKIPTTAQAAYFVEKVRELAVLREIIKAATATVEDCYNYRSDLPGFAAEIEARITEATRRGQGLSTWTAKPLTDFQLPPEDDDNLLLGKYRYLCRGGGLVMVGSSGTGKSSSSLQAAACWALGRDFLGIPCARPLRSLIVQAEDDEGDIAEVWASLREALKLTDREIETVKNRVLIVEDRVNSGPQFLDELAKGCARWKPDLVWLNPFLAFAGCAISEQTEMSRFLRGGLNRINADKKWAYIIVHHTNKPPSQKDAAARNWNEYMYNMAGSAELPNWARAVITIEAKKEEGQFLFRLAKRGKRAGVTKEVKADPESGEGSYRVEVVTKIHAQHSSRKLDLGNNRTLPMMVWEPGKEDADEAGAEAEQKAQRRAPSGRRPAHSFEDFNGLWPVGKENAIPFGQLKRALSQKAQISDGALTRLINDAEEKGLIAFHNDPDKRRSGYYRPL